MSVVGAPSLSAATVDHIFAQVGSPMVGTGAIVEQASRNTNIDDAFALAVWWTETNDGMAGVGLGDRNPGSVRGNGVYPVAYDGYTIYPSYGVAITEWFNLLHNRYVSQGATTVYSISGPYVGTSGSGNWAYKVVNLMARYRNEAPPPTPTAIPQAAPTAQPTPQARAYIPIGNEQNWEQQASAKRHQLWLDKTEGNNDQTPKSQPTPIHSTQGPIDISSQPDQSASQQQPLLIEGIMLLAILLAYAGLVLRRRKVIIAPGTSTWTRTSLAAIPRLTNTEELAPVPPTPMLADIGVVPPTPSLAGIGTVPLTPYMPAYNEAPIYPQHTKKSAHPYSSSPRLAHPTRLIKSSDLDTEQLQPITIGKITASNTETLKPIKTGITLPDRAPVKAESKEGGLLKRFGGNPENS
ncbi:hypothetical protein KSZ_63300 [Dictyobacter formicarum]|uniref:Mannosyl-glycoprotein endo-beta-N-acetylglucosamidase-like domain-containing protein n=2 Tax=Dictyobacter formicarum TaxID=2778368 RepID=A0ABQ3VRI9_9CHLR|nr:hypothetical protein KSZ_63300 [Dictyobacter formicarum]